MSEQHASPATPYEPPRIEAKTSIEGKLTVGIVSGGNLSAVFRPL